MRILVVDDNRTSAILTASYAEEYSDDVLVAHSGEEAVALLEKETVDLILMDVVMPGMDGYETTREIRKRIPDRWFPIMFLTGRDDDDDYQRGIDAGGDEGRGHLAGVARELGRAAPDVDALRDRVHVDDAIDAVVGLLHLHEVDDGAEIVAEVQIARRLDA